MNPLLLRGIGVSHGTTSWHPSFTKPSRRALALAAIIFGLALLGFAVGFALGMAQV